MKKLEVEEYRSSLLSKQATSRLDENLFCSDLCDSFVKWHSMNAEIWRTGLITRSMLRVARVYADTATNFVRETNYRGVASRRTN